jgi:argininosuccinate lyase
MAAPIITGMTLNRERIAEMLDRGHLDATTFMEWLIQRGTPQRTAHHLVGQLVGKALERGCRLADLKLDDFRSADPSLDESVYGALGVEKAVAAFRSYGSTGPSEVRKQIERWKARVQGSGFRVQDKEVGGQRSEVRGQ